MAYTLTEASKSRITPLARGVVRTFVIESPVLDRIPLLSISGNAYSYNSELTLPGVEFRALNAAYAESTGTINQATEKLVILGGDADVDRFLVATQDAAILDLRAEAVRGKVKAAAYKYQDTFINGDTAVDANAFDGIKKRITGAQVIDAGANGLAIVGANDDARQSFLDKLDELLAAVPGADALYMNAAVRSRILSAMRRLSIYTTPIGVKQEPSYNGVPLLDIGNRADGTLIIPQTETQGAASGTASSIYAVRFGRGENDQAVTGVTNGGIQVTDIGELDTKPAYRTRVEFYTGLALFGGKAAGRLRGVLAS